MSRRTGFCQQKPTPNK